MGQGRASGKSRAADAARAAVSSPLLDVGIERATGIVWNITGPEDMKLHEVGFVGSGLAPRLALQCALLMLPGIECGVCLCCTENECAEGCVQVNQAAEIIYDLVDPSANLIFGAVVDPSLSQEVRVQHSTACWPLASCWGAKL